MMLQADNYAVIWVEQYLHTLTQQCLLDPRSLRCSCQCNPSASRTLGSRHPQYKYLPTSEKVLLHTPRWGALVAKAFLSHASKDNPTGKSKRAHRYRQSCGTRFSCCSLVRGHGMTLAMKHDTPLPSLPTGALACLQSPDSTLVHVNVLVSASRASLSVFPHVIAADKQYSTSGMTSKRDSNTTRYYSHLHICIES
ncbi:hypothetical protein BO94DRAFT_241454 [Aspergillus sclerotioniger CBS 115572]|uniref:Uncharacterized protein n=1 Tax=Aspergillus sclerotioniger CBS 115572 TaxID=1450535 RepID=A0A317VFI8_9EURO|nr:hypothetical protein BO94DRAFT_241454 [Aspergillus sclerotioniger CBS 115572]PWY73154.1 hypothetical protein BO94DRAFT_241454 [Aspergillus sclerotioniger CBS 115572]